MYLIFRSILSLVLVIFISSCSRTQPEQAQEKPIYVKFEKAELRSVSQSFETAGEIKADEEIIVSAERQGQVEKIYVTEGQAVNKGQLLVKIKGRDVAVDLNKAQADYDSYQALYKEGAISELEFLSYQATLEKLKSQMSNLNIVAITSGIVGEIYVDLGDYVNLGNPILDLVKLYPLRLSYSIPERLLPNIHIGQTIEFTTDAYPGEVFTAKLDFIAPKVDPMSRTILVRATLNNSEHKLKANQFVTIKQTIKDIPNALMVREEAVYLDQGAEYLYIADALEQESKEEGLEEHKPSPNAPPGPTHTARREKVETGIREPGYVQILSGIENGENVIYAGLTTIYPGAKLVRVQDDKQNAEEDMPSS